MDTPLDFGGLSFPNLQHHKAPMYATHSMQDLADIKLLSIILGPAGAALQLSMFIANNVMLQFFLFWLFGMAMTSFACFISVFLSTSQSAGNASLAIILVSLWLPWHAWVTWHEHSCSCAITCNKTHCKPLEALR